MSRSDRLFRLIEALKAAKGQITAEVLARNLNVSPRTLYRDIDTLRDAGARIDGAPGVGYQMISPPLSINPNPKGDLFGVPVGAGDDPLRAAIRDAYRMDETDCLRALASEARFEGEALLNIERRARELVSFVRQNRRNEGGIDLFMHEYQLSSAEGVALMCLAEALLRIPDAATQDALIEDKIGGANWQKHIGQADSIFVNASTLALMISGQVLRAGEERGLMGVLGRLTHRLGEPVIRAAVRQAMRILGRQFVMGRTIEEAIEVARNDRKVGYRHSFDMLGEAAYTDEDAQRYTAAYSTAITAIAAEVKKLDNPGPIEAPGISIKLSALHPRYDHFNRDRVHAELYPRLLSLAQAAAEANIGLCIDAEEADRLDLSLELLERLAHDPSLGDWQGLGLAVQAYQRRARKVIDWLVALAKASNRRLMVRLVKGAYWDSEIKRAQEGGMEDFPVFTRKVHTDVSYLACARALLAAGKLIYPCFATHNAHSLAAIQEMAGNRRDFEFQRLHGMGEPLYRQVVGTGKTAYACRIYAPVGPHRDLLAYLVRRLLENGANSSFVNRIVDDSLPIGDIIRDPLTQAEETGLQPNPRIAAPSALFAPRRNSAGHDLSDPIANARLAQAVERQETRMLDLRPLIGGREQVGIGPKTIQSPADFRLKIGHVREATKAEALQALECAYAAQPAWADRPAETRAAILERAADLYEANGPELMRLCVREAGKTWRDAIAELREAVDFLRYYAAEARRLMGGDTILPGPTGERNVLRLHARGIWLCISPWNFPLAIFTGQIAAALVTGNAVIAKPAEQTPLIALRAVQLLIEAGVPGDVLACLPGDGPGLGQVLINDARISGVAFTGSTEVARLIARQLADRPGGLVPLIAETGGLNAMIVDTSALPEQVTRDVLASAFQSAGQRCSALRVLYLPEETAERQIAMIKGAMAELRLGDPMKLSTDIGPVIDADAKRMLDAHAKTLTERGHLLAITPMPKNLQPGYWVAPQMFRIPSIKMLEREVFGPILHVVTYPAAALDKVLTEINSTGYGLTLSVHSRIESRWQAIAKKMRVGNIYINRNQIGAIVGSQPFGGEGLSGTGPKAGGPHYLSRFVVERCISADLTAQGGNADLMATVD